MRGSWEDACVGCSLAVMTQKEMEEKGFRTFFLPAYDEVLAKFGETKKVGFYSSERPVKS